MCAVQLRDIPKQGSLDTEKIESHTAGNLYDVIQLLKTGQLWEKPLLTRCSFLWKKNFPQENLKYIASHANILDIFS